MLSTYMIDAFQVFSLLIIACGVLLLYLQKKRIERRINLEKASEFIKRWNSPEFLRLSSFLFERDRIERLSRAQDLEAIDKDEFNYIIVMLNFFEEMGLAVECGLADEWLLRRYFAQSAVELYKTLEPIIYSTRETRRNKAIFITFEKLVGRWSFTNDIRY